MYLIYNILKTSFKVHQMKGSSEKSKILMVDVLFFKQILGRIVFGLCQKTNLSLKNL